MDYSKLGYFRLGLFSPIVYIGNPDANSTEILKLAKQAESESANLALFPELALTGYTCEDLFLSGELKLQTELALLKIVEKSKEIKTVMVFGLPVIIANRRYNCALAVQNGKILCGWAKTHIVEYSEFYEGRWFCSGEGLDETVEINGQKFKVSNKNILCIDGVNVGAEICEDLFSVIPPSSSQSIASTPAELLLNLSASPENVGKADYRLELVKQQAARTLSVYAYVSSGPTESTKDLVYSGHSIVSENGSILLNSERLKLEGSSSFVDVDIEKIRNERSKNMTFQKTKPSFISNVIKIETGIVLSELKRKYDRLPFVPNQNELEKRSMEITKIQATALARRIMSCGAKKIIIGLSGGLDSALIFLISLETCKLLNKEPKDFIELITMPGFGTSERTLNSARSLGESFGVEVKVIDIKPAVSQHFKDIGHSESVYDICFENAQARERMTVLFDRSNMYNGIVVSGGNLSEIMASWSSVFGDHAAGYAVLSGTPKTLVKSLISYHMIHNVNKKSKKVLQDILDTVISPELLPIIDGKVQSTQEKIGPYEVLDFFTYHFLRNGFSFEKIISLSCITFNDYKSEEICKWFKVFIKRFASGQFKRSVSMPGIKIGSVSCSSRGDLRCPDEMTMNEESLNKLCDKIQSLFRKNG
jgi:NAD+ synthase (glutamine-hydrolysing)